jgi:hypothetical protein
MGSILSRLNEHQIEKLSDIFSDVALALIFSAAIPALFDKVDPVLILLELINAIFLWIMSIWIRK